MDNAPTFKLPPLTVPAVSAKTWLRGTAAQPVTALAYSYAHRDRVEAGLAKLKEVQAEIARRLAVPGDMDLDKTYDELKKKFGGPMLDRALTDRRDLAALLAQRGPQS